MTSISAAKWGEDSTLPGVDLLEGTLECKLEPPEYGFDPLGCLGELDRIFGDKDRLTMEEGAADDDKLMNELFAMVSPVDGWCHCC